MLAFSRTVDQVEVTMDPIDVQRAIAEEIDRAISDSLNTSLDMNEVRPRIRVWAPSSCCTWQGELQKQLVDLEQDALNERSAVADHVSVHAPIGAIRQSCTYLNTFLVRFDSL
jgi:hypothetical protein